ncbi:MAG: hypothetical protein EOM90_03255 [Alphaproteobacteria bacterium]|nr:hypothetical protein [Alphaproteobacteria bacterium]
MIIRNTLNSFFLLILLLTGATSCEKFKGDQTIPAYLKIDSIYLSTEYYAQGTASHQITDAWVYIDDYSMGAFELPAKLPALYQGKHKVMIWPGIKRDGIGATRTVYEFYSPITREVTFTEDSTSSMGVLKTTYQSTTLFSWKEDFESISVSLDTTDRSLTAIRLTAPGSPDTFEGNHSGWVVLDTANNFFECQSHEEYAIPASTVYLELNFNISNSMIVGVFTYSDLMVYQSPIITLNPTNDTWKKIYIDLTTTLNAYSGMKTFRVYLYTFLDSGLEKSTLLFDNFKVVTRK